MLARLWAGDYVQGRHQHFQDRASQRAADVVIADARVLEVRRLAWGTAAAAVRCGDQCAGTI